MSILIETKNAIFEISKKGIQKHRNSKLVLMKDLESFFNDVKLLSKEELDQIKKNGFGWSNQTTTHERIQRTLQNLPLTPPNKGDEHLVAFHENDAYGHGDSVEEREKRLRERNPNWFKQKDQNG